MDNNASNKTIPLRIAIKGLKFACIMGAILTLGGCSFSFEIGYHGRTGRDDLKVSPEVISNGKRVGGK